MSSKLEQQCLEMLLALSDKNVKDNYQPTPFDPPNAAENKAKETREEIIKNQKKHQESCLRGLHFLAEIWTTKYGNKPNQ